MFRYKYIILLYELMILFSTLQESIGKLETSVPILQNLLEGKTPLQITLVKISIIYHDYPKKQVYMVAKSVRLQTIQLLSYCNDSYGLFSI